MTKPTSDRNLLFGILALRNNFISSEAFVAAMNVWVLDKHKGLAQILREQRALSENHHALLEESVHQHLSRHANDPIQSLARVELADEVRLELAKIADAEVQASLARIPTVPVLEIVEEEPPTLVTPIEPETLTPRKKPTPKRPVAAPAGGVGNWIFLVGGLIAGLAVAGGLVAAFLLAQLATLDKRAPIVQVPPINVAPLPIKDPLPPEIVKPVKIVPPMVSRKPTELIGDAEWKIDGDELVINNPTLKRAYLFFGSKEWADYDFSFETNSAARITGTLVLFRANNKENHYTLSLGAFLRAKHTLSRVENGGLTYDVPHFETPFHLNQWYKVRIEARGSRMRCYVDEQLVFDYKNEVHPRGLVGFGATAEAKARWKNIKVAAPDGTVLWDGLPELAGTNALPSADFVPLFNGKDLTGWKAHQQQPGEWRVENGILIGAAGNRGWGRLDTEQIQPKDFHLRVEARINNEKGLGRISFRSRMPSRVCYDAPINFFSTSANSVGGLLYQNPGGYGSRVFPPIPGALFVPKPGEWFLLEIIAEGNRLILKVNGNDCTNLRDATLLEAGHIGLTVNSQATVEFRKVEIKKLQPVAPAPLVAANNFVPLFNGKDLAGWKPNVASPGSWRVADGILVGSSVNQIPGRLETERIQPKSFHLRVETRINGKNGGNVAFRVPEASLFGYECPIQGNISPVTGSLELQKPGGGRRVFSRAPANLFQPVPGEWFTLEVIADDNRLMVMVEGTRRADIVDATLTDAGRLALTALAPGGIEFRKIEIRELPPVGPVFLPVTTDWVVGGPGGFVPLFNGKDLTNWKPHPTFSGDWRVQDGILTGSGAKTAFLQTAREDLKNWHLRMEIRYADGTATGASGILARASQLPFTYEATISGKLRTGSANLGSRTKGIKFIPGNAVPIANGEWFTMEMIADENRFKIKVNGFTTADFVDENHEYPIGPITLHQRPNATIEFRRIEIKELPAGVVAPPLAKGLPDGFAPLFNGKDLTGWKANRPDPVGWRVVNGILTGSGQNVGELYTPRDDYGDFHLRLEARINGDGLSNVAFRYPHGLDDLAKSARGGYSARINGRNQDFSKTGGIMVYEKFGTRSLIAKEALMQPGQWFTMDIIAVGNQVITKLNDKEVVNFLNPKTHLEGGRIVLGFSDTNRQTVMEYRRIDIKQFKAVAAPPQPAPPRPLEDFASLLNGKDLTGWRVEGNDGWKVSPAGELIGQGPATALISKRTDYRNFIARVELSASADVDAFFAFRQIPDPITKVKALTSRITGDGAVIRAGYAGNDGLKFESGNRQIQFMPGEKIVLEFNVKQDGIRITGNDKATGGLNYTPDRHPPGAIGLHVVKGSVRITKFEISAERPVGQPLVAADGFVPLFNGKDLTNWKAHRTFSGNWRVENGILIGTGTKTAFLHTTREDYRNWHLRVEVRYANGGLAGPGGLSGRSQTPLHGYETMINFATKTGGGNIGSLTKGKKYIQGNPVPIAAGEWFTMELIADGNRFKIKVNGITTAEFVDENNEHPIGPIGIHQRANGVLEFRKIEVKELPAGPAPPIVAALGFVPLFNGKDLTGWKTHAKQPGDWTVKNGVLTGRGPALSSLYSERGDYQDFHLRIEARINDGGVGGVLSRATFGPMSPINNPDSPNGFLAAINSNGNFLSKTGSMMLVGGKMVSGSQLPPPAGEWFTMDIIAEGPLVKVMMKGKLTAALPDFERVFPRGHIALSLRSPQAVLEFRRIEIKELPPAAVPRPEEVLAAGALVPLFNGKDLTGWKTHPQQPGDWTVKDGILVGRGPVSSLYSERGDYKNFRLTVEARLNEAGLGAVFARAPFGPKTPRVNSTAPIGFHALLNLDMQSPNRIGSLALKDPSGALTIGYKSKIEPGEWFTLEIHATNNRASVLLNGKMLTTVDDQKWQFPSGHIGLFLENPATVLEVRKIDIREMHAPGLVAAPPLAANAEFVPLFNGKDLAGWQAHLKTAGNWRVDNGVLTGAGDEAGILHTVRSDFKDYRLRMEARFTLPADAESGSVLIRSAFGRFGYETVFADGKFTGGLYLSGKDFGKPIPAKLPANVLAGEWFTLEVSARDTRIIVKVDGKETLNFVDDENLFKSGHIALSQGAGARLEFRKIDIQEFKPVVIAAPPVKKIEGAAAGVFVPLFNGKDLADWQPHPKRPGNWRVVNGILTANAPGGGSLYSMRGDYQDFHLQVEGRINDKGFSRVFLRAAFEPAKIPFKILGYEAMINQRPVGAKTGTLTAAGPGNTIVIEAKDSAAKAGEWFTMNIVVKGERVTIKVNDAEVADFVDTQRKYAKTGHIVLHQDPNAVIEFRRVEIMDLGAPPIAPPPQPK